MIHVLLEEEVDWLRAGRDDPRLVGQDDELHAVAQTQLGEHAAHVGLDRGLAKEKPLRDLGIRQSPRHQLEHVKLALRQVVQA